MKHAFSDTLVMPAELSIKPEKREEFLDYTVENLEISRGAPGNISFDILIDEARPDQVLFYEVWESAGAPPQLCHRSTYWRVSAAQKLEPAICLTASPSPKPPAGLRPNRPYPAGRY